jgi:hypothetical protein
MLVLTRTIILGFVSRRFSWPHLYSFQYFYVFWNGASSSTSGGLWLLLRGPGDRSMLLVITKLLSSIHRRSSCS